MPSSRVIHTPLLKMKHQLRAYNVQKLPKSIASMCAPLSETSAVVPPTNGRTELAMKYDIAIHKKCHIPMTANGPISSNLILVKTKLILATLIEFVYAVTKTPSGKQQWDLTVKVVAHKNVYLPQVMLFFCGFDNQHPSFARQILYLQLHFCDIRHTYFTVCFVVVCSAESIFFHGGYKLLDVMLYTIRLIKQTAKDATICIQRCYIQMLPILNTFDEIWTIAIPGIHQKMREVNTTLFQIVNQFQTQFQFGIKHIDILTKTFIFCFYPFFRHIGTEVDRPILSGISVVTGYYYLTIINLTKRANPLSVSGKGRATRLMVTCIVNDGISVITILTPEN